MMHCTCPGNCPFRTVDLSDPNAFRGRGLGGRCYICFKGTQPHRTIVSFPNHALLHSMRNFQFSIAYATLNCMRRFDVQWTSPYQYIQPGSHAGPGEGLCATIPVTATTPLASHVCARRIVNNVTSGGSSDSTTTSSSSSVGGGDAWPTFVSVGDQGSKIRYAFSYDPHYETALFNWYSAIPVMLFIFCAQPIKILHR
jgi:hypothetical protein